MGHADNEGLGNLMNGAYTSELTGPSPFDISHMTSIYGATTVPVPEPTTLALLGVALAALITRRRKPA